MKKVNRNNYEVWMIDYFDGSLNAGEIKTLMLFLDDNPDIKDEFESFDNTNLFTEAESYPDKAKLKKEAIITHAGIYEENYEEWFISYHERDLTSEQKEQLDAFISLNPHLNEEFELCGSLVLVPEASVVYKSKDSLKKKPKVAVYWWAASVAASLLLLFFIFNQEQQKPTPEQRQFTSIAGLEARSLAYELSTNPVLRTVDFPSDIFRSDEMIRTIPEDLKSKSGIKQLDTRETSYELIAYDQFDLVDFPVEIQNDNNDLALAGEPAQEQKKKGPLARIVKNLAGKVSGDKPDKKNKDSKSDPRFVRILDQSITVFGTITGSETELVKTYDEKGNLQRYEFEGETISWSRDVASRGSKD